MFNYTNRKGYHDATHKNDKFFGFCLSVIDLFSILGYKILLVITEYFEILVFVMYLKIN